jgi:diguanylate cyclase (GGDEF)-like protein
MHRLALPVQHAPLIAAVVPLAGWALHSTHLRRRLDAARRDPLTGLVTREVFEHAATRAVRRPGAAVAFVDLDHFKAVNDTHGHAAGDAALIYTADVLRRFAGDFGTPARLGGDEFAAVLPAHSPSRSCGLLAAYLRDFTWNGLDLPLSASVGVCRIADLPAPSLTAALGAADAAMYRAKAQGGGWTLAQPATTGPDEPRRWARTGPTSQEVPR